MDQVAQRPSGIPLAVAQRAVQAIRRPQYAILIGLWLSGLYFMLYGGGFIKPDEASLQVFADRLNEADAMLGDVTRAQQLYWVANDDLYQAKTWFWWFDKQQRPIVAAKREAAYKRKADLDVLVRRREQLLSSAKSALGVWSAAGVEESKQLFWSSYESGKVFARRQSFWDALWIIIGGRDKDWAIQLIQLIVTVAINFATGLTVSVFSYAIRLPWVIFSYQAGLVSGTAFYLVCFVGAISVVLSFLTLMFGAAAGAVYTIAVPMNRRIGQGPQQHPRYIRHQHYS